MAKEFLSSHQVEFEEKDVTRDRAALIELVEEFHSRATPTIVVEDQVVIGFDPQQLETLLGLS